VIHTIDCETLAALETEDGDWIDLAWTAAAKEGAVGVARVQITVENARGVLAQLCRIIAENEGDILNIRTARRSIDFFDLVFDVEVADARHLTNILAALRTLKAVREVSRLRG
jgi:GTP pyrophosphokinase/guanosine-3',5'-bis(diphosphate) 3'-pyrophosphohydrolase